MSFQKCIQNNILVGMCVFYNYFNRLGGSQVIYNFFVCSRTSMLLDISSW